MQFLQVGNRGFLLKSWSEAMFIDFRGRGKGGNRNDGTTTLWPTGPHQPGQEVAHSVTRLSSDCAVGLADLVTGWHPPRAPWGPPLLLSSLVPPQHPPQRLSWLGTGTLGRQEWRDGQAAWMARWIINLILTSLGLHLFFLNIAFSRIKFEIPVSFSQTP